jgi:hypothetical protein
MGMLLVGCLSNKDINSAGGWGLFYGRGADLFGKNLV